MELGHHSQMRKSTISLFSIAAIVLVHLALFGEADCHYWERVGCHKVGHTRKIHVPGCVKFEITTNACRGFCTSYTTPSSESTMSVNKNHALTSIAECCSIMETEDIHVQLLCVGGPKDLLFKSALTCSCFHCKKE